MAYTLPLQVQTGVIATVGPSFTGTGALTPFVLPKWSGQYWGQTTFQMVATSLTVLTADLEIDLSGADAGFKALFAGVDLYTNQVLIYNLNGGNARYRWNIKTLTGTSGIIYAIAG